MALSFDCVGPVHNNIRANTTELERVTRLPKPDVK